MYMVLDSRKTTILNTLLRKSGYVTGEMLSIAAKAALRTIRTDIHDLSLGLAEAGVSLRSMPGLGYFIESDDREHVRRWMREDCEHQPSSPAERRLFFIGALFAGPLNLHFLPPGFSQSPSTREKDLEFGRKWFSRYDLKILRRDEILVLEGSDAAKREAFPSYCAESAERTGQDVCLILENEFPEFGNASAALESFLAESNLILEDDLFERILVYLLSCLRFPPEEHGGAKTSGETEDFINRLARFMEPFADRRSKRFARELYSRFPNALIPEPPKRDQKKIENTLERLRLKAPFVVDEKLRDGLTRVYRDAASAAERLHPPLISLEELERCYPGALRMASDFEDLLAEPPPVHFGADRLVDFGLCFAANLERYGVPERRKRLAAVCSADTGGTQLFFAKLERYVGDAEILGVFPKHSLKTSEKSSPDLFVSTVPLETDFPTFLIPDIFDDGRFEELAVYLGALREGRSPLLETLTENLYLGELNAESEEEVLSIMGKRLIKSGKVADDFVRRVIRRERIMSTCIGNGVAVPHAMPASGGENAVCTALLRRPILWGGESVHTIFLLSLDGPDLVHREIFRELYGLINDKDTIKEFRQSGDFSVLRQVMERNMHE